VKAKLGSRLGWREAVEAGLLIYEAGCRAEQGGEEGVAASDSRLESIPSTGLKTTLWRGPDVS
jgi:hypothetical protein